MPSNVYLLSYFPNVEVCSCVTLVCSILVIEVAEFLFPKHCAVFQWRLMSTLHNSNIFFHRSMFPKSTHETFAQKLYQTFAKNKRFIKPKLSRTNFAISHYAGEVMLLSLLDMSLHGEQERW